MALREPRTPSSNHGQPRNPDPSQSRSYGDPSTKATPFFHQLAKEQLIPQIALRTRNAIDVDRREVFYYQRLRSGRRCSCFVGGETTPQAGCLICHNTGFAGGYLKFGTDTYGFEPSRQWIGVNCQVNPLLGLPPWFSLTDGKTQGYVEWDEVMGRQYYGVDSSYFDYRRQDGDVRLLYRLDGTDPAFIPFTPEGLLQRVLTAGPGGRFRFRVYLTRTTAGDRSPLFQQFWFRGLSQSAEPPFLYVDLPRRPESNVMVEYGALEVFTPIQMVFSDAVQKIFLEDLVVQLHTMTRWKAIESNINDPQNIVTSHDVQLRKIYEHEPQYRVPL